MGSESCHISRLDNGAGPHLCMAESGNLPHPELLKRRGGLHAHVLSSLDHFPIKGSPPPSAARWVLYMQHSRGDRMANTAEQVVCRVRVYTGDGLTQ